ncbi:MAG: hypothetical protein LBS45_11040 [Synergistaceae bacterium]|jgi:hypothetical protein|nr:hypothetical protein [Synergistaceae bacterium]
MMSANAEVRKDMLNLSSTVQQILRALYFYGSDYIMVAIGKDERLLHKDQLVALLEQGRESATVEDMLSLALTEPISAKMGMEDVPPDSSLIVFSNDELYGTTFQKYREIKIQEAMILLPKWWGVPLPLLHMKGGGISLNDAALALIPGGVKAIAGQQEKIKEEKIIVIKEKRTERTFSLSPLDDETFLIEDVSGDFEMVEDLVWWAAIGNAFVSRMERNGLSVRRVFPQAEPPRDAAEIIPCSWEGELIGSLAILLPERSGPEESPPIESASPAAPNEPTPPENPIQSVRKRGGKNGGTGSHKKDAEQDSESEVKKDGIRMGQ